MAKRLSPLGEVAKWIGVPIVLGAIGYYGIGPRLNRAPERLKKPVSDIAVAVEDRLTHRANAGHPQSLIDAPASTTPSENPSGSAKASTSEKGTTRTQNSAAQSSSDGPDVEVTVQPTDQSSSVQTAVHTPAHRRRPSHHKPKPTDEVPVSDPTKDSGSYGGTEEGTPATSSGKTSPENPF